MDTRRVTKDDLCLLSNKVVRIDGKKGNWSVWKVDEEYCFCREPLADIGEEGIKVHFSKLSIVKKP